MLLEKVRNFISTQVFNEQEKITKGKKTTSLEEEEIFFCVILMYCIFFFCRWKSCKTFLYICSHTITFNMKQWLVIGSNHSLLWEFKNKYLIYYCNCMFLGPRDLYHFTTSIYSWINKNVKNTCKFNQRFKEIKKTYFGEILHLVLKNLHS